MLMLITLLNDGTLISIGYDYVNPSPRPEKWNLRALFVTSASLGGVACLSSLLLLWGALDSHNPNGLFAAFNLPSLEYGKITTLIYLKVRQQPYLCQRSASCSAMQLPSARASAQLPAAPCSFLPPVPALSFLQRHAASFCLCQRSASCSAMQLPAKPPEPSLSCLQMKL